VTDCDPTGCDEEAILNMAYAVFDGKPDRMDYKFRTYDATINWELCGSWMVLKDLPKFQNVPGDVDVLDISSISEEGSRGETNKKSNSNERGGKGAKAAKALLAQTARRGARKEALQEHYKRDDEHFERIQSNIENMEHGITMLNRQLKSIADVSLDVELSCTKYSNSGKFHQLENRDNRGSGH
jgi:hypothetical protein